MGTAVQTELGDLEHVVRRRTDEIDRERRVPDDVLAALRATGLNRMAVPVELGGDAHPPARMAALVEEIAAVDGSVGWLAAVGAGSNLFAGYVPRSAASEIWGDVDAPNASMFGPMGRVEDVGGHLVLRGRWPFVSNCLHSSWIGLGALADPAVGSAPPGPRLFFVPADRVTVHDTWDVDGMRGTGSHDVSADAIPIDADRSCSFTDRPWPTGPLWQIPLFNVLAPPLAAVLLGIARGSLALISELVAGQHASARGALADDDVGMADLADAHAHLDGARGALHESMEELWALASDGAELPLRARARGLLTVQHAVDIAARTTSTAHRLAGSAAAYRTHPLARAVADIHTSRQHILFSHHLRPALARAIAGCEVSAPPFL
jgi:indole-3-acetate monooxygenase